MHFVPLRLQISSINIIRLGFQWDALYYLQAVALQANHFAGIVGQETNLLDAQINQNLGANAVIPKVGRIAQFVIGLNRI